MTLVGGPLDGLAPRRDPAGGWIWVDESGRVSLTPVAGKHPYRRAPRGDRMTWLYAGHSHRVCRGCGALHERAERCELCGGLLARM